MSSPRPPLQIIVFADLTDDDAKISLDALDAAISSAKTIGGYVPSMDDLGIQISRFGLNDIPVQKQDELLGGFQHTVVVALVSTKWVNDSNDNFWPWLGNLWEKIRNSEERCRVLPILLDNRAGRSFAAKHPELGLMQTMEAHELGESAIRPAMFALRILHECRLAVASGLPTDPKQTSGFLRLFISHAKIDGLPLALAIKHQIQQTGWLRSFYDADDLASGGNWKQQLKNAASSSIVIILRSEVYDTRYWCQQEVLWAEEYAAPTILVELRTGMNYSAGILPFDRAPIVRVTDGNLYRVIFVAVREGLRFLCFMARVEEMKRTGLLASPAKLEIFCSAPSMPALLRACEKIKPDPTEPTVPRIILYPDPPLRAGMREAGAALVERYAPGALLTTPLTLAINP